MRPLPKRKQSVERPTKLLLWLKNGSHVTYEARVRAETELSIGRTDSRRALGFIVSRGDIHLDFVLNKDQIEELIAYLQMIHGNLLKPLGHKPKQISFRALTQR